MKLLVGMQINNGLLGMKRFSIILLCLVVNGVAGWAAGKKGSNSLYYDLGAGSSVGTSNEGMGFIYTGGYVRTLTNDRIRLNSSFNVGSFSSKTIIDARDQSFRTAGISFTGWYDVMREYSFSIMVGGGTLLNHSKGLLAPYTDPDDDSATEQPSTYFSDYYWGGIVGAGFRFHAPERRVTYEFIPFNIHFGGASFFEVYASVGIEIKL